MSGAEIRGAWYNPRMERDQTRFVERKGKLSELERTFDLEFWQAQPPEARCDPACELVENSQDG